MRIRQIAVLLTALGMLAAGCGGNDDDDDGGAGGREASGTGYELSLADGWTDQTKNAKGSVINIDLLLARRAARFASTVNILREKVAEDVENDDLRTVYRGQLESVGARDITATRAAALDDEDAFTYKYAQKGPTGDALRGRQVALVHEGRAYTITLTTLKANFDDANAQFSEMLRSWRWK